MSPAIAGIAACRRSGSDSGAPRSISPPRRPAGASGAVLPAPSVKAIGARSRARPAGIVGRSRDRVAPHRRIAWVRVSRVHDQPAPAASRRDATARDAARPGCRAGRRSRATPSQRRVRRVRPDVQRRRRRRYENSSLPRSPQWGQGMRIGLQCRLAARPAPFSSSTCAGREAVQPEAAFSAVRLVASRSCGRSTSPRPASP